MSWTFSNLIQIDSWNKFRKYKITWRTKRLWLRDGSDVACIKKIHGVLALCAFHYCEFHFCGFSKLSRYISKNLTNASLWAIYIFCYCVHTWLMWFLANVTFCQVPSSIRREPSAVQKVIRNMIEKLCS